MTESIDHNMVLRKSYRWSRAMPSVTVSPKYQVVIPKKVRERMSIKPGQKLDMMVLNEMIVLVPYRPVEELRGILKSVDAVFEREPDREF